MSEEQSVNEPNKPEGNKALGFFKTVWNKIYVLVQKGYRGLLCEKKEGEWELSKGNVAFWFVLTHCMYVWSGKGAVSVVKDVADASGIMDAPVDTAIEGAQMAATAVSTGDSMSLFQTMAETLGTAGLGQGVPDQEFYFLMALLFYSVLKLTKGGFTEFAGALRGGK